MNLPDYCRWWHHSEFQIGSVNYKTWIGFAQRFRLVPVSEIFDEFSYLGTIRVIKSSVIVIWPRGNWAGAKFATTVLTSWCSCPSLSLLDILPSVPKTYLPGLGWRIHRLDLLHSVMAGTGILGSVSGRNFQMGVFFERRVISRSSYREQKCLAELLQAWIHSPRVFRDWKNNVRDEHLKWMEWTTNNLVL